MPLYRFFLPYFYIPDFWRGRNGHFPVNITHYVHCLFLVLCRISDCNLAICGCPKRRFPNVIAFFIRRHWYHGYALPAIFRCDLPFFGSHCCVCALREKNGTHFAIACPFLSFFRNPQLYERLLLWKKEGTDSGSFTICRTIRTGL